MPKELEGIRGRVIFISSQFPKVSLDILSHYFGQQSTACIRKEIKELEEDDVISGHEKHILDPTKPLFQLTEFGIQHLKSLQKNLEFQVPKPTKKEHIEVLKSRESMFLFDVRIIFLVMLRITTQMMQGESLKVEENLATGRSSQSTSPSSPEVACSPSSPSVVWISDKEVRDSFACVTTLRATKKLADVLLPEPQRNYMHSLLMSRKNPPELSRRRCLAYVRNVLMELCLKKCLLFRSPGHFAVMQKLAGSGL